MQYVVTFWLGCGYGFIIKSNFIYRARFLELNATQSAWHKRKGGETQQEQLKEKSNPTPPLYTHKGSHTLINTRHTTHTRTTQIPLIHPYTDGWVGNVSKSVLFGSRLSKTCHASVLFTLLSYSGSDHDIDTVHVNVSTTGIVSTLSSCLKH